MHRSSENVAAIATALAKAQTELSNPEKAMIGTVYNNRSDSPQNFRYASLSSGLDIIRKAWAANRSRSRRPPTSIGPTARSTSPRSSCTLLESGSRRTGRFASSRRHLHPVAWERP
jgi:hypothetical protein